MGDGFHFQGVQFLRGELVVRGSIVRGGQQEPLFLPIGLAHTIGCSLIELALIAREHEAELKSAGQVLDVNTMVGEFGARMQRRMQLNESTGSVKVQSGQIKSES